MRIAFFGGSFDPPHRGHLRIAEAAADRLALDRVLLAPVAVQPLKLGGPAPASYPDRVAMLGLLLEAAGDPRLVLSALDAPRGDGQPNYTYETLQGLRAGLEAGDVLFLLTGADALVTLPHWHRALELVLAVDLIVAARPGFPMDQLAPPLCSLAPSSSLTIGELEEGVQRMVLSLESREPAGARQARLFLLPDLREDASSTDIRAELADGPAGACEDLTPAVAAYISERGLYRQTGPHATMGR